MLHFKRKDTSLNNIRRHENDENCIKRETYVKAYLLKIYNNFTFIGKIICRIYYIMNIKTERRPNLYAVIDIGSNTIRLSSYEITDNGKIKEMFHKKYFVGLAGYVNETGRLSQKGMLNAVDVLLEFQRIIESIQFLHVYVFATASLRNILNTEEALQFISEKSGFDICVLSGVEEATYDYIGASLQTDFNNGLLIDIGGGSTELVYLKNGQIKKAASFPFGSLNMYTKFVSSNFPDKQERQRIKKHVKNNLVNFVIDEGDPIPMLGIGGTIRAVCKLSNDLFESTPDTKIIDIKSIKKMNHFFAGGTKEAILKLVQLVPERTHTIIPGMTVLGTVAKHYNCNQLTVSGYGVREGYLISKIRGGETENGK